MKTVEALTKRQRQRYTRLKREGFMPFEAKGYVDEKISTPEFRRFRRRRKAIIREARKMNMTRASIYRQIKAEYHFEGFLSKRGAYQPLDYLERFRVVEQAERRGVEVPTERDIVITNVRRRWFGTLINCGFLTSEASELLDGLAEIPVVSAKGRKNRSETWESAPWRAMRETRRALVMRLKNRGYTKEQIRAMIENWYVTKGANVWEWLKREYAPKATPRRYDLEMVGKTPYAERRQREAEAKTGDFLRSPQRYSSKAARKRPNYRPWE